MKRHVSLVLSLVLIISSILSINLYAAGDRAVLMYEQSATHNTFASAQSLPQDYTLLGRITASSQLDYYVVSFQDAGKVNFWLGDIPANCNYNLYVYNSSHILVASSTSTASQELVSNYTVSAGSSYYILVRSSSGYSSTSYYRLRTKWYPSNGFIYYYNKNPSSTIGSFPVDNMASITNRSGYNIVTRIKDAGCFVTSYAMILANLGKTTTDSCYDPRTGTISVIDADPVAVTLANMGFPNLYSNGILNDFGDPVTIRNFDTIAESFDTTFNQYYIKNMTNQQKIVAITYYLTLNPEGIVIRFNNNGAQHALVVTNSGYNATESEVSSMLNGVTVMSSYSYPVISAFAASKNVLRYDTTSGSINDNNGGNYFTVYDPAYYGTSQDGSLTLSSTWTAHTYSWSQLEYIEAFN